MQTHEDEDQAMTFGGVIRKRRMELGLTQEALAERVGDSVRQSDISRLEHDYVTLPRRDRLEALARAMEVTPGYLLFHSGWITRDEQSLLDARYPNELPVAGPPEDGVVDDRPSLMDPERADDAADRDPVWSSGDPSELRAAIARAVEMSHRTDDLIRETRATIQNARRSRRARQ